jgi:plasmid maintenance system antidote protein VapI
MYQSTKKQTEVQEVVQRINTKMRQWGITVTFLAQHMGVSRQYAWQIVHYRTFLSRERALEIERHLDGIIAQQLHLRSFGDRLRAARLAAGLTLKEVASMIGYSWVGVERWERNICRPKPGVLWHLLNVYGAAHAGGNRENAYTFQDLREHLTPPSRYARAG